MRPWSGVVLADQLLVGVAHRDHQGRGIERRRAEPATGAEGARLGTASGLYYEQGKYARAEPLHKRSLAIRKKAFGPDHPDVATSLGWLATLYQAQGKYARAEPLFERALAILEKALGPEHPMVAQSLENYAALLRETQRGAEATKMDARAKAIHAKHAQGN